MSRLRICIKTVKFLSKIPPADIQIRMKTFLLSRLLVSGAITLGFLVAAQKSHATSIIRTPNPPRYNVEIEPHLLLQPGGFTYMMQV